MKEEINIKKASALLMFLFLSWGNFQIFGLYFYIIFQVLYCIGNFVSNRKRIYFSNSILINWIFICLIISSISGILTNLPDSFKKYSLVMVMVLIPSYFAFTYLFHECRENRNCLKSVIYVLKIGFIIQIMYLPIQFLFYKLLNIDLNDMIFNKILHLMNNPTFFRQGTFFPSAFVWHSAVLAPMLVLAFLLFDSIWIRCIVLLDAFLCGNSTALVGVLLVIIFLFMHFIVKSDAKISKRFLLSIIILLCGGLLFISMPKGYSIIYNKVSYLLYRVLNASSDTSSAAHISYYTLYPKIIENNGLIASLFGTGYASSGYSITNINGQYAGLQHWVVESDFIDILVSRGIIGFISYYAFLFYIGFKGKTIDYRYIIAIVVIMVQGITYNVQFEYLFFIELIMYGSIKLKINFFEK